MEIRGNLRDSRERARRGGGYIGEGEGLSE